MSVTPAGAAVKVEDIADLLQLWLDRTPSYAADISASMSELLEIGGILCTLDNVFTSPTYGMVRHSIEEELNLILKSLSRSLMIVKKLLGSSGPIEYLSSAICGRSWEALQAIFLAEGPTFHERLELYRLYLQELLNILQGYHTLAFFCLLNTNKLLVADLL